MLRILDESNIPYENDIIKIITPLGYWGTAKFYVERLGVELTESYAVYPVTVICGLLVAHPQAEYFGV